MHTYAYWLIGDSMLACNAKFFLANLNTDTYKPERQTQQVFRLVLYSLCLDADKKI